MLPLLALDEIISWSLIAVSCILLIRGNPLSSVLISSNLISHYTGNFLQRTSLAIVLLSLVLLIFSMKRISFLRLLLALSIVLFLILNLIIASNQGVSFYFWLKDSYVFLVFLIVFVNLSFDKHDYHNFVRVSLLMGFIAFIRVCLVVLSGFSGRVTTSLSGVPLVDLFLLFNVVFATSLLLQQRNSFSVLFIVITNSLTILLSQTRSALLALLASVIALLVLNAKEFNIRIIARSSVAIAVVLMLLRLLGFEVLERFFDHAAKSTVYAKIDEWATMLAAFFESPFFGKGVGYQFAFTYVKSLYTYSHNIFVYILSRTGISGLLFFVIIAVVYMIRIKTTSQFSKSIMIGLLVGFLVLSQGTTSFMWLSSLLLLAIIGNPIILSFEV